MFFNICIYIYWLCPRRQVSLPTAVTVQLIVELAQISLKSAFDPRCHCQLVGTAAVTNKRSRAPSKAPEDQLYLSFFIFLSFSSTFRLNRLKDCASCFQKPVGAGSKRNANANEKALKIPAEAPARLKHASLDTNRYRFLLSSEFQSALGWQLDSSNSHSSPSS